MTRRFYFWNKQTNTFEEGHPPPSGFNPNLGVITDEISPTVNHADGQVYTSKAKFREATRARGYEEVGTEKIPEPKKPSSLGVKQDLIKTFKEKGYL